MRSHDSILAREVCVEGTCALSTSEPQDGGFVGPFLTSCKVYALHPQLSFHSLMQTCSDGSSRVPRTESLSEHLEQSCLQVSAWSVSAYDVLSGFKVR